jgi:hypothetical protein
MTARQIAETKISDSGSDKTFDAIPQRFKHAPDLAINPLSQHDTQYRRRNGVQPRNLRALTRYKDAVQQSPCEGRLPVSIQRELVFLVDFETRMGKVLGEFAVVGQENEPFALRVEPADIEQPRKVRREQVENRVANVWIASGANKAGWFVQRDRERRIEMKEPPIKLDMITHGRLRAEVGADFAVNGDTPSGDQFVAFSPRTDASSGEVAIETHGKCYQVKKLHC